MLKLFILDGCILEWKNPCARTLNQRRGWAFIQDGFAIIIIFGERAFFNLASRSWLLQQWYCVHLVNFNLAVFNLTSPHSEIKTLTINNPFFLRYTLFMYPVFQCQFHTFCLIFRRNRISFSSFHVYFELHRTHEIAQNHQSVGHYPEKSWRLQIIHWIVGY